MVEFDLDFQDAIREVEEKGAKATAAEWLARVEAEYGTAHMQVAKKMGIPKEEILEAVLVAGLLANSSVLANAYRVVIPDVAKQPCGASCSISGIPAKKEE